MLATTVLALKNRLSRPQSWKPGAARAVGDHPKPYNIPDIVHKHKERVLPKGAKGSFTATLQFERPPPHGVH